MRAVVGWALVCLLSSACTGDEEAPTAEQSCVDGLDEDADGVADCADPDCTDDPACTESCFNDVDDDLDGAIDCADADCAEDPACQENCINGVDDDGDGAIDCLDPECGEDSACDENCLNGVDDDADGLMDCLDSDCAGVAACNERYCTNGLDDDADGHADCADSECFAHPLCIETGNCADLVDNDLDLAIDCADVECVSAEICEPGTELTCVDGFDNDGDGAPDCADSDCDFEPTCCIDDAREPDDVTVTLPFSAGDLWLCSTDVDHVRFDALGGDRVVIDVRFLHQYGDLDLELVDPEGSVVEGASTLDNDEHITFDVRHPGTYDLRILGVSDAQNTYDVDISSACVADGYEPNDADPSAVGSHFGAGDLTLCPGDEDWFEIWGTGNGVTVKVDFTHAYGNVDVELFDESGAQVALLDGVEDGELYVLPTLPVSETYRVRVFGDQNLYDIDLAVGFGSRWFVDSGQALGSQVNLLNLLGDLDGDGDLDVLTIAEGGSHVVWVNDGAGTYRHARQELGSSDGQGGALGDLDGDGDLDVYVANGFFAGDRVLLNDGAGQLLDSGQLLGDAFSEGVALADFDDDGDLDAFVTTSQGAPDRVWLNDGTGTFTSGQGIGNWRDDGAAVGDFDGDEDLDVFVVSLHGNHRVFLNDGAGNLDASGQVLSGASATNLQLGDLDGDGDLDAFVPSGASYVYLNDGGQFFDSGQRLGASAEGVTLRDFDDDGDLDAFVVGGSGGNHLWLNDGGGSFSASEQGYLVGGQPRGVASGDIDGDGDFDLVVADQSVDSVWFNVPQCGDICVETACEDQEDNDLDGLEDCADPDCDASCVESLCADGSDDDGNGLIDCLDPDCAAECASVCPSVDIGSAVGSVLGSTVGALDDSLGTCAEDLGGEDVTVAWTAPESRCYHLDTSGHDTTLYLLDGCTDPVELACDADGGLTLLASRLELDAVSGEEYLIVIDGHTDADSGLFELDITTCPEVCDVVGDEDANGDPDCADAECALHPICELDGELSCRDGYDNDANGDIDCDDPNCEFVPDCVESACSDGEDNDGDLDIDCFDSDCASDGVCELGGEVTCTDHFDNDADDLEDCADPDCASDGACELGGELTCGDGFDNDGDGAADCDDDDCLNHPGCPVEFLTGCDSNFCVLYEDAGANGGDLCECAFTEFEAPLSDDVGPGTCFNSGGAQDILFHFDMSGYGAYAVDTCTWATDDSSVVVFDADPALGGVQIACNDEADGETVTWCSRITDGGGVALPTAAPASGEIWVSLDKWAGGAYFDSEIVVWFEFIE